MNGSICINENGLPNKAPAHLPTSSRGGSSSSSSSSSSRCPVSGVQTQQQLDQHPSHQFQQECAGSSSHQAAAHWANPSSFTMVRACINILVAEKYF